MTILHFAILALALTSLSVGATAGPDTSHRFPSSIQTTAGFGSCAKGPCIRRTGTASLKVKFHAEHRR
jgi:hypothetical protein